MVRRKKRKGGNLIAHVAEVELQKLQRQFRAMESERKAYAEESKVQLGKQRSAFVADGERMGQVIDPTLLD